MKNNNQFDAIIIGGSYSGLAAAMALGRALKTVLVIDSGKPCNRQTPYSHNFITQDGSAPAAIAALAKRQVAQYKTVQFFNGLATHGIKIKDGFEITTSSTQKFIAEKLIFATGIRDIMPEISGFAECWGISVLHCPYCHGYEVKQKPTAIFGNGEYGYEFSIMISNWTNDLALFTNGPSSLTAGQTRKLKKHGIRIVEKKIAGLEHANGHVSHIIFTDGSKSGIAAIYARPTFEQHSLIPETLGCECNPEGYLKVDASNKTTAEGIYACGDNVSRLRTVANAVAMGTATGMAANKEIIFSKF